MSTILAVLGCTARVAHSKLQAGEAAGGKDLATPVDALRSTSDLPNQKVNTKQISWSRLL